MKFLVAAGVLGFLPQARARQTRHVQDVVMFDIEKRSMTQDEAVSSLQRRGTPYANVYEEKLFNGQTGYFTKVRVGTPPQELFLHVDTGSSDIWIPATTSPICEGEDTTSVCTMGSFKQESSETFELVGKDKFNITYFDNNFCRGDYFKDNIEIGGALVKGQMMALGHESTVRHGIAGIGYHHIVASASKSSGGVSYNNLPINMMNQGLIKTLIYSFWLNDLDADYGSLMFGGVDAGKFIGSLTRVPVLPNGLGWFDFFRVPVQSVTVRGRGGEDKPASDRSFEAVLDTGATLSFLPSHIAKAIWKEVGAVWFGDVGAAMLPCSSKNQNIHIEFRFGEPGGPIIKVPLDELMIEPGEWPGGRPIVGGQGDWKGQRLCQFGLRNTTQDPYILGDTFMRSAYVVHDLLNHEVALAQTKFNSTKTSIIPMREYGMKIPRITSFR